jgi:hypothetical protein
MPGIAQLVDRQAKKVANHSNASLHSNFKTLMVMDID